MTSTATFSSIRYFLFLLRYKAISTLGEFGQSAGGLRKDIAAFGAVDDGVGVGEHGRDGLAGVALDVHVERIRRLDDSLQLVGCCLLGGRWVEDIFCEGHLLGTFFCRKRGLVLLRRKECI